ncbi:hypothetical protein ABZ721_33015 [Streptomyces sp. NPDC006733]
MTRILTDSYERELQQRHEQRTTTGTGRSWRQWIAQVSALVRARSQARGT